MPNDLDAQRLPKSNLLFPKYMLTLGIGMRVSKRRFGAKYALLQQLAPQLLS
jgi:hypothetical protein